MTRLSFGLILILVVTALPLIGCNEKKETQKAEESRVQEPAPAADKTGFAGAWATTFGKLTLTAQGDKITGVYKDGALEGIVKNGILSGTWTEDGRTGTFEIRLGPENATFKGRRNGESIQEQEWVGIRMDE